MGYTNTFMKSNTKLNFLSLFPICAACFSGSFSTVTDSLRSANLPREGYQCKLRNSLQVHFVLLHENGVVRLFFFARVFPGGCEEIKGFFITLMLLYFGRVKVVIIFWVLLIFLCFNKCHDSHHSFTNHSY